MPFTDKQLEAIDKLINGWTDDQDVYHEGVCDKEDVIIKARIVIMHLIDELHMAFATNAELMDAVQVAKTRARTAAESLVVLLT